MPTLSIQKETLADYFPPSEFNVFEETDSNQAARLLESKASCCWGQGPIGSTGYFQLAKPSKEALAHKRLVIVCKQSLITGVAANLKSK